MFVEDKVYQLHSCPPKKYFSHILSDRTAETQAKVQNLIGDRQLEIEAAIYASDLKVYRKPRIASIKKKEK